MTTPLETRRAAMIRKARAIALQSTEWLSVADIAKRSGKEAHPSSIPVDSWIADKRIFAITIEGVEHFPAYGLCEVAHGNVQALEPKPIMAAVLAALGEDCAGWQCATWFASVNGYLDAVRPLDAVDSAPERVVQAAVF